jgi:hypothetical protein
MFMIVCYSCDSLSSFLIQYVPWPYMSAMWTKSGIQDEYVVHITLKKIEYTQTVTEGRKNAKHITEHIQCFKRHGMDA